MDQSELARALNDIVARLDDLSARLGRIETELCDAQTLRAQLQHESDSRRALADQTAWLIEVLSDTRRHTRWLEQERSRLAGESPASG